MERCPAEPKRSRKDKAKKEPVDDEGDEEEEELAVGGGGGGEGVEEEDKWKPSSATASGAGAASSGGGGIVGVARRGSGGGGGGPQPCCQAERCTADLTEAKRYYRRHKVCEVHSKAPVVVVAGLRQRFCQQCSRFHELSEFDDAKRSCRRRLAGHNERRRKTTSESQTEGSNHCRQADSGGRMQISVSGNPTYKHFQIR